MTTQNSMTPSRAVTAALLLSCAAATATAQAGRVSAGMPQATVAAVRSITVSAAGERSYNITVGEDGSAVIRSEADPQVKDDLMEGLDRIGAKAKERNEVNLDKNMMALAGHRGGRYADLGSKMDFITVRSYEFAQKGQYQKSDLDTLRHKLEGNGWTHLVRNEDEGETNDIVVKSTGDGYLSDVVIFNAEPREVNVVHLRGHFRMEDVNGALGSAMGMEAGTFGMAGAMGHMGGGSHPAPPSPPASPAPPASAPRP